MGMPVTRSFELTLPNDTYFEYKVEFNYTPENPGNFSGPPESCFEAEPADCELYAVIFFDSIAHVIEVACLINNCVMSYDSILNLAEIEETRIVSSVLNNPPVYEPEYEPEYE